MKNLCAVVASFSFVFGIAAIYFSIPVAVMMFGYGLLIGHVSHKINN